MTLVCPRLPRAVASSLYADVAEGLPVRPATSHGSQIWSAVGNRVDEEQLHLLNEVLTACAAQHGFPASGSNAQRVAFDRAAAVLLRQHLPLTWAEAGTADVWSFFALVVLPDVTLWRFGAANVERWIASDLTRHTWARLWWHAESFGDDVDVLAMLAESELNQILERRSIGGNPNVVRAFSRALADFEARDASRRALIRDVTKRLLRRLAYVDGTALSSDDLTDMCRSLLRESAEAMSRASATRDAGSSLTAAPMAPTRRTWLGRRRSV